MQDVRSIRHLNFPNNPETVQGFQEVGFDKSKKKTQIVDIQTTSNSWFSNQGWNCLILLLGQGKKTTVNKQVQPHSHLSMNVNVCSLLRSQVWQG